MTNPIDPVSSAAPETESFQDLLTEFERSHARKYNNSSDGSKQLEGKVIDVSTESVFFDIGFKTEGIMPLTAFASDREAVKAGDIFAVSVKGRDSDGYYELSRFKTAQPKDWSALERAFAEKATIVGTVTGVVKGGLSVDVGVRAFMPASRSGAHDATDLEKLVEQEIRCRIIKLDVADEDVVVDRRVVTEQEERATKEQRYSEVKEGETVRGTVRSLTEYGAFVDLGGVDGLLHVSDIAWTHITRPEDALSVGQEIEAKVLKIDPEKKRISLGLKQLQPHPWDGLGENFKVGERVRGTVTRVVDFGAFVEVAPGVEGLIHLSEMTWAKKARKPSDVVKTGDTVEVVILSMDAVERRMGLGLKQALGDPWAEVAQRFPAGSVIEGPVTSIMKFGAFVQLAEGVEGMIHVSEISAEKRIEHPQDVLKLGQVVKAQVLEVDSTKRQLRLSMKQLSPVSVDEYLAEHAAGDVVTGRLMDINGDRARVELGEGIYGSCRIAPAKAEAEAPRREGAVDMSAFSSMLKTRWKNGPDIATAKLEVARAGQIRSFKIVKLDAAAKSVELELIK